MQSLDSAMRFASPLTYGEVLLCAAAAIGMTVSWKVANATFAAVAFLGCLGGVAVRVFH